MIGEGRGVDVVLILGEDHAVQVVLHVVVSCERESAEQTNKVTTWLTGRWILPRADKDEYNS